MFSTSRLEPPSPSHPPFLPSTSPLLWKMEELCGLLFSLTHGVIPAHLQLGDKWEFNYFQRVRETEKLVTYLPFASHWEMKYVILVKKWTFIPSLSPRPLSVLNCGEFSLFYVQLSERGTRTWLKVYSGQLDSEWLLLLLVWCEQLLQYVTWTLVYGREYRIDT